MSLKEWAAATGVSYATAWRRYGAGVLPVATYRLGWLIVVGELVTGAVAGVGRVVVYARVSSVGQRADLDGQVARVTDVASALSGHRGKVLALLRDPQVSTVLVEHRDRFAHFGAVYAEAALAAQGRRLLVVGPAGVDEDLLGDGSEILTSLCVRRYGPRAAADRASQAVAAATAEDPW